MSAKVANRPIKRTFKLYLNVPYGGTLLKSTTQRRNTFGTAEYNLKSTIQYINECLMLLILIKLYKCPILENTGHDGTLGKVGQ